MKKFTGNFLLGEHSFGNVLRRIGLSMVAILMAVAVFAQPQETYHVWAENVSDCYRNDNTYEVDISMRDFIKIDTFSFELEFDETVLSYTGLSYVIDTLQTGPNRGSGLVVSDDGSGTLTITWGSNGDPIGNGTIGETADAQNDTTVVFTLEFELSSFPLTYGPVNQLEFDEDLSWGAYEVWNSDGQISEILTDFTTDGSIHVTQGIADITLEDHPADCDGLDAMVIVTDPAEDGVLEYSFNGNTFTTNGQALVAAPSTENTVRVKDGECVSYFKKFDVDAPEPLAFTTADTVYTECPGGLGDIEIIAMGGTPTYKYYIIPEADTAQVYEDLFQATSKAEGNTVVEQYLKTNNVLERAPGYYIVAVQDANDCIDLRNLSWWKEVTVIDNKMPWDAQVTIDDVHCHGDESGAIIASFSGGTPFADGYNIWLNGTYIERGFDLDETALAAGSYVVLISDSTGCDKEYTMTVTEPDPIYFEVTHTDASCNEDNGTITIDTASITGGSGDLANWWWVYSTNPPGEFTSATTDTVMSLFTTADSLPPAVYYVKIIDDEGCPEYYRNINEDDAVKVLTTEFEINHTDIACNGGTTDVSIDILTGDGNHDFWYAMNSGTPQQSNIFEDVAAGTHTFTVIDSTIDCTLSWTKTVEGPDPIVADIAPLLTLPPTCPGNSDGNLTVVVEGGTPFETSTGVEYYKYKMDDGDWIQASMYNTFAIDTAAHDIYIEDAKGCSTMVTFDWPNNENIIEFQDTIWNDCAMGEINLFNERGEDCQPIPFDVYAVYNIPQVTDLRAFFESLVDVSTLPAEIEINGMTIPVDLDALPDSATMADLTIFLGDQMNSSIDMLAGGNTFEFWNPSYYVCPDSELIDFGYLEYFEWYGIPLEQFTGTITFEIDIWTSDSGWVTRTIQGVQQLREPVMYMSTVDPDGNPASIVENGTVVTESTSFPAGDYWLVAKDEWGCYSNIEPIVIMDPPALDVTVSTANAGCAGSTDGMIMIEASNGTHPIPNLVKPHARYQYVLTQQPEIFTHENWIDEVTWVVFTNGDFENDSLAAINVQEGTYYLAVRDFCSIENPDLIVFEGPIEISGADAIEVSDDVTVTGVSCVVTGEDIVYDGSITGVLDATSGGYGDYEFSLDLVNPASGDGDISWPIENKTGDFADLPGGEYVLTITDSTGCMGMTSIVVPEPDPLNLETLVVFPSCYNTHDGILRYMISGGTAPYHEATNNVGEWESPSDIPAHRWVDTSTEGIAVHGGIFFDRRVRAGSYDIWVKDANGCIYGPISAVVHQPAPLTLTATGNAVSCNDQSGLHAGTDDDGTITITYGGGWENVNDFTYTIELWSGSTILETHLDVSPGQHTFTTDLDAGDYVVKISQDDGGLYYGDPITSNEDYWDETHLWWSGNLDSTFQNPDSDCHLLVDVTIDEPTEITYGTIDWRNVKCHNEASGEIYVPEIAGGTKGVNADDGFDGYLVGLQGPADYDPTLQSNWSTNYYATTNYVNGDSIVWFETLDADEFTFDNLIWGHYTFHVQDANGCWIIKESGEVENVDTLIIERVERVNNASCVDGLGTIQIDAMGGSGQFLYAVDSTLVPDPGSHLFPNDMDEQEYLDGLNWQVSDTFNVTPATWIGYVKDTINGCVTGFATDKNGAVILQHRVVVLGPEAVVAQGIGQQRVVCFGESNGVITIDLLDGGNGAPWVIDVTGTDYRDSVVNKTYTQITDYTDIELTGLYASTDKTDPSTMGDDDYYTIVVTDRNGCQSMPYKRYVQQAQEFVIELKDKQNAFICPNDKAGLFEIDVVSGGNPFGTGPDGEPSYMYKWEAYSDSAYTMKIDSLSDEIYGFTKSFLGYAGLYYRVHALDALDCETSRDTFIAAPNPVAFEIKELTCWSDSMASARVSLTSSNEGRQYRVQYQMFEDNIAGAIETSDWFTESIDLMNTFTFDNESLSDVHYAFWVEDSAGCNSMIDTMTFDFVQIELVVFEETTPGECKSDVELLVTGGTPDYTVTLNGEVITDMMQVLGAGSYVIAAEDAHECTATRTFTIEALPVSRDTTIETYIGMSTQFVDAVAGVDTMLYEGDHMFPYVFGEDSCIRTLNVMVVGVPMPATLADVQGDGEESPWVGAVVEVTGTVTGVAPGEGFFMQDANAAWSGVWVAWSASTSAGIQIGNGVKVIGSVAEVASVTTINATEVTFVDPVLTVMPMVVEPGEAENEMYESVLVKVEGARATAEDEGNGEWVIFTTDVNDVIVNDWLYDSTPTEGNYYDVTGIVNARLDAFKLEPRMLEDVVDLTAVSVDPQLENIQFKVYPNPFNDRIMIDNNDKLTRVIVSNVAGQRVIDVEYPSHEIRTANLVSGVYFVSLITEEGIAKTERIVKR